jgi:hypothetical protein
MFTHSRGFWEEHAMTQELDVVTLPDGRMGTVVSLHDDGSYTVEVSDEAGRTLELVNVLER